MSGRVLRFHPRCQFANERHPALLAVWRNMHTNKPTAVHRRALTAGGEKHPEYGRKWLAPGPTAGAAIKLTADEDVASGLIVGEGIKTTLAGMALGFRPAWALGSAGAIRKFPVLAGIECLTILVDRDQPDRKGRQAGPDAAAECSTNWTAAGREVLRVVPDAADADMADVVRMSS